MRPVKRFSKSNITIKLLMVILPVILAALIVLAHGVNIMISGRLTEEISTQLQLQADSVAEQISAAINEADRLSFYAYSNIDMRGSLAKSVLKPDDFTPKERNRLYKDVIDPMFRIINSPLHFSLVLYPMSDAVFCDYNNVKPISMFPEDLPLQEMIEDGYAHTFYNFYNEKKEKSVQPVLCVTRVIYHSDRTPLGVLNMNVMTAQLESSLKVILPEEDEYWYRLELADGQILFEAGELTPDMVTMSSNVADSVATLYYGVDYSFISQQIRTQMKVLLRFGAVVLVIVAVLIVALSSLVMHRFSYVLRKYSRLEPGQELEEEPLSGNDEAAMLDQSFTHLYRDYRERVQTEQRLKENQRRLESNLLLSRINPHFLYNTLSAIRWSIPVENWEIIDNLVAFYRGMLAKGRETATLLEELELMRQYVDLQRFTYSRKVEYTEEIDSDTAMLIIPKFLLQPVLENAFKYSRTMEVIHITIAARREGEKLILTVSNDGETIDSAVMQQLNSLNDIDRDGLLSEDYDVSDKHGYGIFNIILRIRLFFGEGYGLIHEQIESGGTRAMFTLPKIMTPDELKELQKTKV